MPPMTTESLPAPAPTRRQELIDRLAEPRQYDLAVIGGGATGLGVALDAAARGFSVVLVESHDFAKGTSSRATKLVHGGVRYLAQGNISLVREALHERGIRHFLVAIQKRAEGRIRRHWGVSSASAAAHSA